MDENTHTHHAIKLCERLCTHLASDYKLVLKFLVTVSTAAMLPHILQQWFPTLLAMTHKRIPWCPKPPPFYPVFKRLHCNPGSWLSRASSVLPKAGKIFLKGCAFARSPAKKNSTCFQVVLLKTTLYEWISVHWSHCVYVHASRIDTMKLNCRAEIIHIKKKKKTGPKNSDMSPKKAQMTKEYRLCAVIKQHRTNPTVTHHPCEDGVSQKVRQWKLLVKCKNPEP